MAYQGFKYYQYFNEYELYKNPSNGKFSISDPAPGGTVAANSDTLSPGSTFTDYESGTAYSGSFVSKATGNKGNTDSFIGHYSGGGYYLYTPATYKNGVVLTEESGSINLVCYAAGTLIRTVRGDVPVETLKIGDHVITASGAERPIRWIGHRAYAGRFANNNPELLPIRFKAGSIADAIPARDLWVSPKHAMFLDGVLIPAEHLVNGVSVVKAERVDSVTYYHVELDSHDVLLAEGTPSESFVDDNGRAIFQNAHEFFAHYPDADDADAVYCAPRVEDGYILDRVRRRIAERAGLLLPSATAFGPLRGRIDRFDAEGVCGWAQDQAFPDGPVCVDILIDGGLVARVLAHNYRADLLRSGVGDGRHAFKLRLPVPLARDVPHEVVVRRSADGAAIGQGRRLDACVETDVSSAAA